MKRALFFSLLVHLLLLAGASFFLPSQARREERYTVLAVSLTAPVEPGLAAVPQEQPVPPASEHTPEENPAESRAAGKVEKEPILPPLQDPPARSEPVPNVPDGTDTQGGSSDIMEAQESPGSAGAVQDKMIKEQDAGPEPAGYRDNTMETESPAALARPDRPAPVLDIRWAGGGERILLEGDSPDLDIARNALLMEQVQILFSLHPDGSVHHVRILPPGSNNFQVDRQLREWANLLVFETSPSGKTSEGLIRINLHAREMP